MLSIHLFLLLIGFAVIWLRLNDRDEVHDLAALSAGAIALVWGFVVSPLPIQLLMSIAALGMCFRFQSTHDKF
jgi:Na+/H+-dicarboxylate symporter